MADDGSELLLTGSENFMCSFSRMTFSVSRLQNPKTLTTADGQLHQHKTLMHLRDSAEVTDLPEVVWQRAVEPRLLQQW
jgi:hypothetical protein